MEPHMMADVNCVQSSNIGQPFTPVPSKPRKRGNKALNQNQNQNDAITIEEALKTLNLSQDMKHLAVKTPVSILQELLSRRGITPTYELVQIEGAIHEPTFRYRVSFNDKDAMGAGKSKKEAKHAAAKCLIDKLTGIPYIEPQVQSSNGSDENSSNQNSFEDKVVGNPIGWLQELCMARRWPPPTYETEMEIGLPHERQFTMACVVLKNREIGQGKSKKIAKRLAAHKMWLHLQESPMDSDQINALLDEEGNEEVTCLNDPKVNYVQFLHEIANEHQFEVTYVDIEEKTISGRYQCLVQLSTLPVAVCHGSGTSSKDAQSNAARNALDYLKIMTKTIN